MPQFSEYLFAPWKIFGLLLSGGTPPAPGTAAAAAQGQLCYAQDVGGQISQVCRIGSIEMPSFIFFASWGILLFFIASSIALLRETSRLGSALSRIADELDKLPAQPGPLSSQGVQGIREILTSQTLTAPLWMQFEDSLVRAPTEKDEVFTSQAPDSVFSRAAVLDENLQGAFYAAVPGVLTGVGLLMTFVAILDGLSHVTVSANMDVKGIGGLINGLSGKFVSSIVAVSCAVAFVFVERVAHSKPSKGYRKLIFAMNARFRRLTTEHLLIQLHEKLRSIGLAERV